MDVNTQLHEIRCIGLNNLDTKDKYHVEKLSKIKDRKLERFFIKYGDNVESAKMAYEEGFFDEDQSEVIRKIYNKYFSREGIQHILNREGDPNVEFLKKTIFRKVSYPTNSEYNLLFDKHEEEGTLDEFCDYIEEIKNTPIEGKTEFTFEEVIADDNICGNDDGQIFTNDNYIYEFDDIAEMGCVGTWGVISDIIRCIRNSETEEV